MSNKVLKNFSIRTIETTRLSFSNLFCSCFRQRQFGRRGRRHIQRSERRERPWWCGRGCGCGCGCWGAGGRYPAAGRPTETLPVYVMRFVLHPTREPQGAHAQTHRRPSLPVHLLQQGVHACLLLQTAHAGRNKICKKHCEIHLQELLPSLVKIKRETLDRCKKRSRLLREFL